MNKKYLFKKVVPLGVKGAIGWLYRAYTQSNKIYPITQSDEDGLWYLIDLDDDLIVRFRPITIEKLRIALHF